MQTLSNTTVQLHPRPRKLSYSFQKGAGSELLPALSLLPCCTQRVCPCPWGHSCPPLSLEMLFCHFACPCSPLVPPEISVHPGPRSTQGLAIRVAKMAFFALLIYLTWDFCLVLSRVLTLLCRQEPICTLNQREKTRRLIANIKAKILPACQ